MEALSYLEEGYCALWQPFSRKCFDNINRPHDGIKVLGMREFEIPGFFMSRPDDV